MKYGEITVGQVARALSGLTVKGGFRDGESVERILEDWTEAACLCTENLMLFEDGTVWEYIPADNGGVVRLSTPNKAETLAKFVTSDEEAQRLKIEMMEEHGGPCRKESR